MLSCRDKPPIAPMLIKPCSQSYRGEGQKLNRRIRSPGWINPAVFAIRFFPERGVVPSRSNGLTLPPVKGLDSSPGLLAADRIERAENPHVIGRHAASHGASRQPARHWVRSAPLPAPAVFMPAPRPTLPLPPAGSRGDFPSAFIQESSYESKTSGTRPSLGNVPGGVGRHL